ncbi:DUF3558 domain-containing protein [Nocardia nova]|uniref:DUF3558 domain-containing protein n=1 Tax=Nocardia nova TaxID=37330 RepID=UPI00046D508B|nr:DUF3558 domain-containing protein [Nocardia nova]
MVARRVLIVLLAAVVPVLAACNDVEGNGVAGTSAAAAPLWDPCTQIPDDVLQQAGVDPATKESGIAGVHQSGWEICNWRGRTYHLNVLSTGRAPEEIENKDGNVDFRDVTIAGRQGRQFRTGEDGTCDVVFPATQGSLQLTLVNFLSADNLEDPCQVLERVGAPVVPVLPK